MNDSQNESLTLGSWDHFWFAAAPLSEVARIRALLCLLVAVFFLSCLPDAGYWYAANRPLSSSQTATFLQTAGLEQEARSIVSPLFLTENLRAYQAYCVAGVALAAVVASGHGGRTAGWLLWLMLVGWANRSMILSGLVETLLSLGLFAVAIAPPAPLSFNPSAESRHHRHWTAGLSLRLLAVQITILGLATFVTMLGGRVWWNGLGAYALAAPAADRTIDWTGSLLVQTLVHEPLTHAMVIALPLGFLLAWCPATRRVGQLMLFVWCVAIALLGSLWLYAAAFATMVLAIGPGGRSGVDT